METTTAKAYIEKHFPRLAALRAEKGLTLRELFAQEAPGNAMTFRTFETYFNRAAKAGRDAAFARPDEAFEEGMTAKAYIGKHFPRLAALRAEKRLTLRQLYERAVPEGAMTFRTFGTYYDRVAAAERDAVAPSADAAFREAFPDLEEERAAGKTRRELWKARHFDRLMSYETFCRRWREEAEKAEAASYMPPEGEDDFLKDLEESGTGILMGYRFNLDVDRADTPSNWPLGNKSTFPAWLAMFRRQCPALDGYFRSGELVSDGMSVRSGPYCSPAAFCLIGRFVSKFLTRMAMAEDGEIIGDASLDVWIEMSFYDMERRPIQLYEDVPGEGADWIANLAPGFLRRKMRIVSEDTSDEFARRGKEPSWIYDRERLMVV